ncbi:intimin ((attaching and effacing protein) or invasin protein (sivH-like) [Escherichia coli]|uniref:Intimin ((Attaching and effacing protein) or invasin protein (SivH-like)) n=1 Tax=Escherichia coli TaxID=562 RepID=A0A376L8Y6_ECOLX|nr:intimin ((attaching and effacing protein) or invasin protein (sivH-like) [Escherichia coli]
MNLIGNKEPLPSQIAAIALCCGVTLTKTACSSYQKKLTEEEMKQYDYQWEFTGHSVNGNTGAQANTTNADIEIPATNKEAATKFSAQVTDGVQGYGLQVNYSKK